MYAGRRSRAGQVAKFLGMLEQSSDLSMIVLDRAHRKNGTVFSLVQGMPGGIVIRDPLRAHASVNQSNSQVKKNWSTHFKNRVGLRFLFAFFQANFVGQIVLLPIIVKSRSNMTL